MHWYHHPCLRFQTHANLYLFHLPTFYLSIRRKIKFNLFIRKQDKKTELIMVENELNERYKFFIETRE